LRQRDGVFITVSYSKQDQGTYLNGIGPGLDQPLWRLEGFHFQCDAFNRFCDGAFSPSAGADGVEYISLMAKDQPEPPAKQLHAVDARSGRLLWRHLAQPVMLLGPGSIQRRSDDGTPMVADGRVIIRVDGSLGPVPVTSSPGSFAYRALHAKTGEILWTTEGLPRHFKEPWTGTTSQQRGTHIAAGGMLVTEVLSGDGNTKELWTYRLADGRLAWRRPVPRDLRLMASAGGVIHVAINGNGGSTHILQGLDSMTGTLLWSTEVAAHNNPITQGWDIEGDETNVFLGPFFRIASDGAIYGTTVTTAYKLD
jgi:outer membrane protein assembly factor BamB